MKPPWLENSQETAELEALQTDVMRFIAILGLFLAAIFSLLHSASLEQASAAAAPLQEGLKPQPQPQPQPQLQPTAQASPTGFTLEFASADVLQSLLQEGNVQLYAMAQSQYWSPDDQGSFTSAQAPASYYHMHADTVPRHLREALEDAGVGGDVAWGVVLPLEIVRQIEQRVAGDAGGSLFIGQDGRVDQR